MFVMSFARALERRAKREVRELRKQLKGRQRILIDLAPTLDALRDKRIGHGVAELLAVASASAASPKGNRQCFCCHEPWTAARGPVVVLSAEFLQLDRALLAGICRACSTFPDLERRLRVRLGEDLGFSEFDTQCVAPPSRA